MKLKNAIVGARVQVKDVDVLPTLPLHSTRTSRQYGLTEENEGTIIKSPDSDNDVLVRFDNFSHVDDDGCDHLYVNVEHLRKVK